MDLLVRVDDRLRKAFGIRFIHVEHGIRKRCADLCPTPGKLSNLSTSRSSGGT